MTVERFGVRGPESLGWTLLGAPRPSESPMETAVGTRGDAEREPYALSVNPAMNAHMDRYSFRLERPLVAAIGHCPPRSLRLIRK